MIPIKYASAALLGLLIMVSAPVQAEEQVAVGQVLAPAFNVTLVGLDRADDVAPPAAQPLIDVGRNSVILVRDLADATILGATDGDIGSDAGTPDQYGAVTPRVIVVNGIKAPSYTVTVPERQVPVETPPVDRTIYVPGYTIPPRTYTIPDTTVVVRTPPVNVPGFTYTTPPVVVTTPPVSTPPVTVSTPPVDVAPTPLAADVTGLNVQLQSLHGQIHLGGFGSVPYETPAASAGEANLPPGVPRSVSYTVPGANVPGQDLAEAPGQQWLPGMTFDLLGSRQVTVDGMEVLPGQEFYSVTVPGRTVNTPGYSVPPTQRQIHLPGMEVITVTVPGFSHTTDEIVFTEQTLILPPVSLIFNGFPALDDFGYFGYGFDDDSSMYPYVCGPVFGCFNSDSRLRGYVNLGDAVLDLATATVDGSIVVIITEPTADRLTITWPNLPPIYVTQIGATITD